MKTVLLYARVDTGADQVGDPSLLQKQLDELKDFCAENTLRVNGVYSDVHHGATFERERFQELLNDLETEMVQADAILFTSWDRFSRNLDSALLMAKRLRTLKVKALSIQDVKSNLCLTFLTK
ncbi:MAG: site-specific recombinase, invertase Pin [Bacteroidetes bacterium]|jgi:DNA invertase Pin-like site-specific DNA recombinase|nr:site-specific recombinase, invertase Pin [Bacteroidota bacterium]